MIAYLRPKVMPCPHTDPVAALDWLFSFLEKDLKESKMWPIRLMQHKHQDTLRHLNTRNSKCSHLHELHGVGASTTLFIQGNLLGKHSQLIEEKYFVLQQWKVQKDW